MSKQEKYRHNSTFKVKSDSRFRRSPFKAKKTGLKSSTSMSAGKVLKRSTIKRQVAKANPKRHNKTYLEVCRGECCYLRVGGVCLGESGRETVVPCHSNQLQHGKGMGIKAHDEFTVPGCFACHAWIDQGSATKKIKFLIWDLAFARWMPIRARKLQAKENPVTVGAVLGKSVA